MLKAFVQRVDRPQVVDGVLIDAAHARPADVLGGMVVAPWSQRLRWEQLPPQDEVRSGVDRRLQVAALTTALDLGSYHVSHPDVRRSRSGSLYGVRLRVSLIDHSIVC